MFAVVLTQPLDVIKTKLQTQAQLNKDEWNPCKVCANKISQLSQKAESLKNNTSFISQLRYTTISRKLEVLKHKETLNKPFNRNYSQKVDATIIYEK